MDTNSFRIFVIVAALLAVYGVGTTLVILTQDLSGNFVVIILRSYGTMFAGFIGLIAGFLAGRR